jgi:hypothetical protein
MVSSEYGLFLIAFGLFLIAIGHGFYARGLRPFISNL